MGTQGWSWVCGQADGKPWVLWVMAIATGYHPALSRGSVCTPSHSPTLLHPVPHSQLWGPHTPLQLVGVLLIFQFDELKIHSTLLLTSQEGIKNISDPIKCH